MKVLSLCFPWLLLSCLLYAQRSYTRKYDPAQAIFIIDKVARLLDHYQPGAYRYQSPSAFSRYVDSIRNTVTVPLTELELYRKVKPIVSSVGCLHTDLITVGSYKGYLNRDANLLPLRLFFEGSRAYVITNYSTDTTIRPGDEIIRINGMTVPALLQVLLPAIPADGYNLTMKYLALYHQFPTWYRAMVAVTDTFAVTVRQQGRDVDHILPGYKKAQLATAGFLQEFNYPQQLTFKITDSIGMLTIHTFANSAIRKSGQHFSRFMEKTFRTLQKKRVPCLVVDLRYNTGGSDDNAALFTRYFFDQPFRYWDRIVVTEKTARQIRGFAGIFYRKPVWIDSVWRWQKGKTVHDFDYYEIQQPAAAHYTGKVYVLINGFCMSSCADVAAILSDHKKAVFVGSETGGGFQGNNSGIMPGVNLKPSKMVLTLPLQAYYTAVKPAGTPGHGTMPDYPVNLTVPGILSGRDQEMDATLALIRQHPDR